jgi:hypothetical protein
MHNAIRKAIKAIVTVGENGGRGFVVKSKSGDRYVITAAHCLPQMPKPHPFDNESRIWKILGPRGKKPKIYAECAFVDPVADIAALKCPDYDELRQPYDKFFAALAMLPLGKLSRKREAQLSGWLLALDGKPFKCRVRYREDHPLSVEEAAQPIVPGMSGSPILAGNGVVIGVVSTNTEHDGIPGNEADLMPRPDTNLPVWLVRQMPKRVVPSRLA